MTENQPDHDLPRLDRPKPLRDRVYEIMRHQILSGQFQPGQHLAEEQLAEQFGVSRTPVREAFQRLKIEGLVVESGNGRLRVQHLTK